MILIKHLKSLTSVSPFGPWGVKRKGDRDWELPSVEENTVLE